MIHTDGKPTIACAPKKYSEKYLPIDCTEQEAAIIMEVLDEISGNLGVRLVAVLGSIQSSSDHPNPAPFEGCECDRCQGDGDSTTTEAS